MENDAGFKIDAAEFLVDILSKLPKSKKDGERGPYEVKRDIIERDMNTNTAYDLDDLTMDLTRVYDQLYGKDDSSDDDDEAGDTALATFTKQFKGTCRKCGKFGHMAKDCRSSEGNGNHRNNNNNYRGGNNNNYRGGNNYQRRQGGYRGNNNNGRFNGSCNYCNKPGHKWAAYKKRLREQGGPGNGNNNNQDRAYRAIEGEIALMGLGEICYPCDAQSASSSESSVSTMPDLIRSKFDDDSSDEGSMDGSMPPLIERYISDSSDDDSKSSNGSIPSLVSRPCATYSSSDDDSYVPNSFFDYFSPSEPESDDDADELPAWISMNQSDSDNDGELCFAAYGIQESPVDWHGRVTAELELLQAMGTIEYAEPIEAPTPKPTCMEGDNYYSCLSQDEDTDDESQPPVMMDTIPDKPDPPSTVECTWCHHPGHHKSSCMSIPTRQNPYAGDDTMRRPQRSNYVPIPIPGASIEMPCGATCARS